ncbi:MAG: hypothetical protein L0Y35_06310 [Flammeovirgaceae bacterium]|nr:hypothetical protein [Flammeovirgaceae bacterium]
MIEEITQQLWEASERKRVCRIKIEDEFLVRVVHPYGICRTPKNQIVLVCWQAMGFTKAGGKAGYRNLLLSDFEEVEILDIHFQKREDFNPSDAQYKEWVYHI